MSLLSSRVRSKPKESQALHKKMSAGAIPTPQIIALITKPASTETNIIRKNIQGPPKNRTIQTITSNTLISITSSYKEPHAIFFTVDETPPKIKVTDGRHSTQSGPPFRLKPGNSSTIKYEKPFLVNNGKRVIRAVAVSFIDGRESHINSKVYNVEYVEPDTTDDDLEEDQLTLDNRERRRNKKLLFRDASLNSREDSGHSDHADTGYVHPEDEVPVQIQQAMPPVQQTQTYGNYPNFANTNQMLYQNQNPAIYANPNNLDFGGMSLVPQPVQSINFQMSGQMHPVNPTGPMQSSTIYNDTFNEPTKKIIKNKGTQTAGLFYPGSKRMQQEEQKRLEDELNKMKNRSVDHLRFLNETSPGAGYWRKQIDHVNGHIRQYGAENLEFRSLIADQKFGKILHSHIDETTDQVTLSFTFELHGLNQKRNYHSKTPNYAHDEPAFGSRIERGLDETDYSLSKSERDRIQRMERERNRVEKNYKRGRSPRDKSQQQNPVDRLLINVLKKNGDNLGEIEQLLSEGASPNAVDYGRGIREFFCAFYNGPKFLT